MKSLISTALLAGIMAVSCSVASAQESSIVAVLDVAKVFKENEAFKSSIDQIQAEAAQLKAKVEAEQQQIREKAQQISEQYAANSEPRRNAEADLEQQQTTLRTFARQSEQALLTREAKAYFDTYTRLRSVVAQLAESNKISLVLRFDSSDIDPTNRGDVIKGVNRGVVYQNHLDLTDHVIEAMTTASAGVSGNSQLK